MPLDNNRTSAFEHQVSRHLDSNKYKLVARGVEEFISIYGKLEFDEISAIAHEKRWLVENLDDFHHRALYNSVSIGSLEMMLGQSNTPRHIRRVWKAQLKTAKKDVQHDLRRFKQDLKAIGILAGVLAKV